MEQTQLYDYICTNTYAHLYSLSKEGKLYLKNFNYKDEEHLFIYEIGKLLNLSNVEVFIQVPSYFNLIYIKFIKKFKKVKINSEKGINIADVIENICSALEIEKEVLKDIYREYYKVEK